MTTRSKRRRTRRERLMGCPPRVRFGCGDRDTACRFCGASVPHGTVRAVLSGIVVAPSGARLLPGVYCERHGRRLAEILGSPPIGEPRTPTGPVAPDWTRD